MSIIVKNIFNKVKEAPVVNRSLVMCQVAKEIVTSTLNSSKTRQQLISEVARKVFEMDKVYLDACVKVTRQEESDIRESLEFKILEFSANKLANIQSISKNELQRLTDANASIHSTLETAKKKIGDSFANKKNAIAKILVSSRNQFSTTFDVKIKTVQNKVSTIKSKSVSVASAVKESVRIRYSSTKKSVSEQVRKSLQAEKLKELISTIEHRISALNNLTAKESANLKANLHKVQQYVSDQLTASQFLTYLKKNTRAQMENLKGALRYLKQTFDQNASTVKNFNSHTAKFAESIASKNKKVLKIMKTENAKLATNYFNRLEIELYYSPKESIRLVEKFRAALSYIFGDKRVMAEKVSNGVIRHDARKLVEIKV